MASVGLERFCREGWELPEYVEEFDRPGIAIWEPEGGWEAAWEEARELLTDEEWKRFIGEAPLPPAPADSASASPEETGQGRLELTVEGE